MKSWLGSGERAKAPAPLAFAASVSVAKGSSSKVRPAISVRARSPGSRSESHSRSARARHRTEGGGARRGVDELGPRLGDADDVLEQVGQVHDDDAALAHDRREGVVLLPRALGPRDVVEQQLVHVRRRDPRELVARAVQQDAAQPPGLGVHAAGDGDRLFGVEHRSGRQSQRATNSRASFESRKCPRFASASWSEA